MPRIAVFCGASVGRDPVYAETVERIGCAIVIPGLTFRIAPKRFLLAWDTFLIAVV